MKTQAQQRIKTKDKQQTQTQQTESGAVQLLRDIFKNERKRTQ